MKTNDIGIVVAEDHALVRQGMRLLLSQEPRMRWLAETGSGAEVLSLVRQFTPDVLILDLGLPQLPGLDIIQALQAEPTAPRILVVTARQDSESVRAALALGSHGYLLKSNNADELIKALTVVADGGVYISTELADVSSAGADITAILTARESEIASGVGRGLSSKQIAYHLSISEHTVRKHRENIARKLGFHNTAELVAWAVRKRL
jgi:DNA-binding NarL/FixJ family response regulator